MPGIIELDDKRILGLLDHPTIPKLFPCFGEVRAAKDNERHVRSTKRCPKCWTAAAKQKILAVQAAKHCLVHMSAAQRRALRAAIGADKIRITLLRNGKQPIVVIF